MFDRLEFMISEAFVAMRRNWLMSLAAISTVSVALFLLGGLGYVYWRVSGFAEQMPGKFDMKVFVLDGTLQADVRKLAIDLRAIKGVKTVVLIPKEREWAKQQQKMPDVTQGVENPLPDSFKVTLEEISNATRVSDQIKRLNNLDPSNPVVYDTSAQQLLSDSLYLVRWLGGVLGTLLFCTAGVLINNAIKMTVISRRREIRIMQLVGSAQRMIRTPFLIEGLFQGATGGFIAAILLWAANRGFQLRVENISATAQVPPVPLVACLGLLSLAGATYGIGCSYFALRGPLKFR